jgi:hypothetical protein
MNFWLTLFPYLWKYGNMDTKNAVVILSSLAQDARLEIFRLLVRLALKAWQRVISPPG